MSSSSESPPIAVVGAAGALGRRVCAELARRGALLVLVGRDHAALIELGRALPVVGLAIADAGDPAALTRALAEARAAVVANAAGPLADTAAPVLTAALAAGAHYVDVGGEQAVLHALYERHESATRRARRVALPGAGLDCMLGDLAAGWLAQQVIGAPVPAGLVRGELAGRLGDDNPLDEVTVSYVFDELALSPGTQRALFGTLAMPVRVWRRDRWELGRAGAPHRVGAGPLGVREALGYAGGDPITIPQHVCAHTVASYVSATRGAGATTALRFAVGALRRVPQRAVQLLVPYAAADTDYAATRFAVIVEARRAGSAARIAVSGRDIYRTTAAITAWAAWQLATRGAGPLGMRAPGELFHGELALRELALAADLTIEPSFG